MTTEASRVAGTAPRTVADEEARGLSLPLLVVAGLVGGIALVRIPPKQWSRAGALLFGASAWLLRSPIGPSVLTAIWAGTPRPAKAPGDPAP